MDLRTMFNVGSKATIAEEAQTLGLDFNRISGETGQDFCEYSEGPAYWMLPPSERRTYDEKANDMNSKAKAFWIDYLRPISTTPGGVQDVLEAVLNHQLPNHGHEFFETQVNANCIIGLFPFLDRFTPRQNTLLLDIFASPYWYIDEAFRLTTGTDVLFAMGKPTVDLIDQLIPRALSWTKPDDELDALVSGIGYHIQKHWPGIAQRRIVDLCGVLLSPERPRPPNHGGRTVPGDKILEVAMTSPGALKTLLPIVLNMCRRQMISTPEHHVLTIAERFGVDLESSPGLVDWIRAAGVSDRKTRRRLMKVLADAKAGKFEIKAGLGACSMCHKQKVFEKLFRCARCLATVYCSRDCQRTAWGEGHKVICDATDAAGKNP